MRLQALFAQRQFRFDGLTYEPKLDMERLGKQMKLVAGYMQCGRWMTLAELSALTGAPEASVSARLRDLRKPRFGGHTVDRRRRSHDSGTWEYRLRRNGGWNDIVR